VKKGFCDVTIACEDDQLQAHKVILSACRPFFNDILIKNPHQKGVKYSDLQLVLNFMYHGEVYVAQDELISFLTVGKELQVLGLAKYNGYLGATNSQISSFIQKLNAKPSVHTTRPPENIHVPHRLSSCPLLLMKFLLNPNLTCLVP